MLRLVAKSEMAAQFTGWDGLADLPGRGFCYVWSELADRCAWSKLKPLAWRQLLMRQPQFADKCDFMLGGKIMQFAQSYCIKL